VRGEKRSRRACSNKALYALLGLKTYIPGRKAYAQGEAQRKVKDLKQKIVGRAHGGPTPCLSIGSKGEKQVKNFEK